MAEHINTIIDNRSSIIDPKNLKQSIIDIDPRTARLRARLEDPNLGQAFVRVIYSKLPESQIENIAEYVTRKANHKGKAFVALCSKVMKEA